MADAHSITRRSFTRALGAATTVAGFGFAPAVMAKEATYEQRILKAAAEYRDADEHYNSLLQNGVPKALKITQDRTRPEWLEFYDAREAFIAAQNRLSLTIMWSDGALHGL